MADLSAQFQKAGVPAARRHVFVCAGSRCCTEEEGSALWEHVKLSMKEHAVPALRTKVLCLRICAEGPWLVVYPEGTWYSGVTPGRFDRIRREHLEGGTPVAEWVCFTRPLAGG